MKNKTALVTGVGRKAGIGTAIAERLREDGWNVVTTYWSDYDRRMPWGADETVQGIEADLADPATPAKLFDRIDGDVQALVLAHCESVDSSLLDTTVDSFDRHFAVNARASWPFGSPPREAITQHTPLGRVGTPQDCAGLVAFLCGPEGGWVNGQVLVANGGAA